MVFGLSIFLNRRFTAEFAESAELILLKFSAFSALSAVKARRVIYEECSIKKAVNGHHGLFDCKAGRLFLLRLFFFGDHFAPIIVTAVRAHGMRAALFAAVGASNQRRRGKRIVRAAAVAAAFGMLSFWKWRHGNTPSRAIAGIALALA